MEYQQFIKPELLTLIPVLYLIGTAIKKSQISDRFIPLIIGIVSIVLALIWTFTTDAAAAENILAAIYTGVTQGVLCAGATVYANQLVKQSEKKE